MRFAILCDAHLVDPIQPVQQRILDWARQEIESHRVDVVIHNGDLTHQADATQARLYLDAIDLSTPSLYLPGNNEGGSLHAVGAPGGNIRWMHGVCKLTDWPGSAWAIGPGCEDDMPTATLALAAQLPTAGHVLVLCHYPPESAGPDGLAALNQPDLSVTWLSGHLHHGTGGNTGNIRYEICGGLDPFKVQTHTPELCIGDWDGARLRLERLRMPIAALRPAKAIRHPVALGTRLPPSEALALVIGHRLDGIEFNALHDEDPIAIAPMVRQLQDMCPDALLSQHLPAPLTEHASGPDLGNSKGCIEWGRQVGVNHWTIHMPGVPASMLYTPDRLFADSDWARNCLLAYERLAEKACRANIALSIENVNNKPMATLDNELLSSRPWHLTLFIERLRQMLRSKGLSGMEVNRIGANFDMGHAFSDPIARKQHGLANWLEWLAPYLQVTHTHQCIRNRGIYTRHVGIDNPCGPMVNFVGYIAHLQERLDRPVPLIMEIREPQAALHSSMILRQLMQANR